MRPAIRRVVGGGVSGRRFRRPPGWERRSGADRGSGRGRAARPSRGAWSRADSSRAAGGSARRGSAFGSRPNPMRASTVPSLGRSMNVRDRGPPTMCSAAPAGGGAVQQLVGQGREQDDPADAPPHDLGVLDRERLHRDAAHGVADDHHVAQVEAPRPRCGRRRPRLSNVWPDSPASDSPCPRWSNATTRNPASGSRELLDPDPRRERHAVRQQQRRTRHRGRRCRCVPPSWLWRTRASSNSGTNVPASGSSR